MLIPFQRLLYHQVHGAIPRSFLLAGTGPSVRIFDGITGQLISKWSHLEAENSTRNSTPEVQDDHEEESPKKRRKLDDGDVSDTPSAEIVTENGSRRRKPKRHGFTVPCITHLCGTADGKHVVVVTGEDKAIRVLSISENGVLHQLSQRIMPKRPSSLAWTPAQDIILCSDKFGDIYSLPLLGFTGDISQEEKAGETSEEGNPFLKPSASEKTVHTKRNLRVLEEQKKQKKIKKEKAILPFQHSLLLGHVSLLTDIACAKVKTPAGPKRTYILSADRDEHIRVSRGIPQAHIIETFCLGHEQFISKMHIPAWQPETLISGGGDDYLLVWDWKSGTIKEKIQLKKHILSLRPEASSIAVSNIWSIQTDDRGEGQIIVTCEAVPGLFFFYLTPDGQVHSEPTGILELPHNVLDVAVLSGQQSIIVSMDNAHQPWTTDIPSTDGKGPATVSISLDKSHKWSRTSTELESGLNKIANTTNEPLTESLDASALSTIFYTVEHLRKRRGVEDNDGTDGVKHDAEP